MITAKEAKVLYDQSGVEVDLFLEQKVELVVVCAAQSGKRTTFIYCGSRDLFTHNVLTPLHRAVMAKLQELGYLVKWVDSEGDTYVPRGLTDDDGNGPAHVNYGIRVSW